MYGLNFITSHGRTRNAKRNSEIVVVIEDFLLKIEEQCRNT